MPKAPKMVVVALVWSLLTLPVFGVREEGLERSSFSSQPLNPLHHRPAGLIEVEAGTGGRETENEDECDKELQSLERTFAKTCERPGLSQGLCRIQAKETVQHSTNHRWQKHLARKVLDAGKTPVFWAGFWPGGKKDIDTREALADFISSVNGFQLADTKWGKAAESEGANNLEACTWDRKKYWWKAASISMAKAMALHKVPNIIIALHKTLHGNFSFYNTILYQAELKSIGYEMWKKSNWNPEFEVRSIAVKGAPRHESGCALASEVKDQLEFYAKRPVTVWCRPCTTLQACEPRRQCIGNCRNGQGTKTWANGEEYEGQWKNGKKDGQGTLTYADGNKYQGDWKEDKMDGQGTMTYANGNMYQGDWKEDKMDGQGIKTWANGNMYQGGWKEDKMDGQGIKTWANSNKYKGGWKNGLKDGQGTYTWANGNKYQGDWKEDKMDGQGTMTYANGNKYQGDWKEDKMDGQGTMTYANGNKYQGGWKKDKEDGQGTMTYANALKKGQKDRVWYKEGRLTKKQEMPQQYMPLPQQYYFAQWR